MLMKYSLHVVKLLEAIPVIWVYIYHGKLKLYKCNSIIFSSNIPQFLWNSLVVWLSLRAEHEMYYASAFLISWIFFQYIFFHNWLLNPSVKCFSKKSPQCRSLTSKRRSFDTVRATFGVVKNIWQSSHSVSVSFHLTWIKMCGNFLAMSSQNRKKLFPLLQTFRILDTKCYFHLVAVRVSLHICFPWLYK